MTTLQEQFEKDFPNKGVKEISVYKKYIKTNFTDYDLDLRVYKKLVDFGFHNNKLTSLNVSGLTNLSYLECYSNKLTSIYLPNSEKLIQIIIYNNNIQPTDISVFSNFVNLEVLKIGTESEIIEEGKHNKFYGSLKSYQNLTKLEAICIEATDVNEGLEYLPMSLAEEAKERIQKSKYKGGYYVIECSPHNTNAKCKAIQDQLRPFNYDLEAWQLAHPEKMLISRPEYFTNPDSKEKWIKALADKITNSQQELQTVKDQEADKIAKITRLESKISELETAKVKISQQTQTEFSTQDKSTQTDLTMEQIKQWEETNKKTLYQKFIEKYGKK